MKLTREDKQRLADKCAANRRSCPGCDSEHLCNKGKEDAKWLADFIKEIDPGRNITVVAL